ncbi:MAG: acyltransferase [Labilithrix sp.]|nr:acyltransferase [Labilithrix sp.]
MLCCTVVVVGHCAGARPDAALWAAAASMGVNVFFSLSGFLIVSLLLRERAMFGSISLRNFYARRAIRIFPVYYAALLLSLVGCLVLGDAFARPFGSSSASLDVRSLALSYGTFMANWSAQESPSTLAVLWSVCVEEQFYLLFPIALWFVGAPRWSALRPIVIGLAACWSVRACLAWSEPQSVYRNTFAHGDHILLGALLAQLVHEHRSVGLAFLRRFGRAGGDVVTLALLVWLVVLESYLDVAGAILFVGYFISAVLCALLVGTFAGGEGILSSLLSHRVPRYLGQLTYSGYVFHMYAVAAAWAIVSKFVDARYAFPSRVALAVPLTFVGAHVVRIGYEARFLSWKARFSRTHGERPPARTPG